MINPVIDIDALPSELQSIGAGVDLELFRGNHLGFTQNKIETDGSNTPFIKKSALFGLIDYEDQSGFEKTDTFEFRVNRLQVLFSNSEVKDFYCLLKVRVPQWFKDAVKEVVGGPTIPDPQPGEDDVFAILGRYQSFIDPSGRKINRYSFVYDKDITVKFPEDMIIFDNVVIDRVELRTTESVNLEGGNKKRIVSELLIDSVIGFKDDLGAEFLSDVLSFDRLEITGLTVPFSLLLEKPEGKPWKKLGLEWPDGLKFDGISLGTDPNRRRREGFLSKFPIKFRTFRLFDNQKPLSDLGFTALFPKEGVAAFEYGFEWDVDFGALAKMLGLDSDLKGTLLVGWLSQNRGISVGLRFDDMGGDRLDIGIGSVLRLRAGYFDVFSPGGPGTDGTFIVASDLSVEILGNKLPQGDDKFGLLLAPNPEDPLNGSLGWLTTLGAEQLGFIEDFTLSVGQRLKYIHTGGDTPKQIIEHVRGLQHFALDEGMSDKEKKEASETYRSNLASTFEYSTDHDWFIGIGGGAAEVFKGYALYNPPTLFGGEVELIDFLSISIMYKQETPQVGIYTGTLTLAEDLRSIDLGGVRIQLPRIMVKVDTDGGYVLIVGLNLDQPDDFSNAAGAEVGIFKGDGGFMYASIHGSAFKDIPRIAHPELPSDRGLVPYSPVTRIMLSARVGLGRELRILIFRGGASITIYGILSGTWGTANLKYLSDAARAKWANDHLPTKYNKFLGEIGVLAEIYGIVDFGVTRQRLTARLLVEFGILFETWRDTIAYIRGELKISLDWVIARFKVFGKTIEIKIHLSFSTEFREEYPLIKDDRQALFNRWFGQRPTRALGFDEVSARSASRADLHWDWTRTPVVGMRKDVLLVTTLDLTLDDDGAPQLAPMTFIPFKQAANADDPPNPGAFKMLVNLVFDWSLAAAYADAPAETDPMPADTIRAIAGEIAGKDWQANRGSWSADAGWGVLNTHFNFTLVNEADGELAGGTFIMLPTGYHSLATFDDGTVSEEQLGATTVPENYLKILDEFFDGLRIKVEEERGVKSQSAAHAARSQRPLMEMLFEEYLESLLRAVWGRILPATDRPEGDSGLPQSPTVATLRALVAAEADAISGMINRQAFNGSRVPATDTPDSQSTIALYDKAGLTIDVSSWAERDVQTLTLTQPTLNAEVSFDVDDSSVIDELSVLEPVFGQVELEQVKPFEIVSGGQHPLVEQAPLLQAGARIGTIWTVPEHLAAKAYDLKFNGPGTQELGVTLEPYVEGERNPDVEAQTTPYDPVVMIGLPVLGLPGSGDAFVLQQMKESDRRLLDDFLSSNVSTNDYVLEFIGHKDEDDNGPGYMFKPELTLNQSFIGRVNLSEDPNPTSISRSLAAVRRSEPDYHVRPVVDEKENYKAFLDLVKAASETNSGGYVLRLAGWPNAESRQIWLSLRCTGSSFEGKLASFASRLVTFDTGHAGGATAPSAPLALRETAKQVAAVGEPGVFCLQVKRPNSDRLFQDPSSRSVRPRTLTREQALNIMESEDGLPSGHMVDRDRRNGLPADTMDRAGGREVDMAKRFNLLQVQIVDSNDFNPLSNRHDLPTGPEKPGTDPTDDYVYSWSVPAYSLAKAPANDLYPTEQPNDPFIYAAIDRSMEVRASFRDVLGFSPDSADDFQGVLTGKYFDPIVSLLSLSGLRVSHRVAPGNGELEIRLHFTPAAIKGEDRDEARIMSIRAQYTRAMQQVRDANTTYYVESSLGLRNGEGAPTRKALTPQQREGLYRDLKRCRNAFDRLANGQDVAAINLTSLTFAQTGAPPAGGVTRYQVRWLTERRAALVWPEVAAIRRSKVVSIASDIPLFASKDDADACEVLASAIAGVLSR